MKAGNRKETERKVMRKDIIKLENNINNAK